MPQTYSDSEALMKIISPIFPNKPKKKQLKKQKVKEIRGWGEMEKDLPFMLGIITGYACMVRPDKTKLFTKIVIKAINIISKGRKLKVK